jgi:hypothetical protein
MYNISDTMPRHKQTANYDGASVLQFIRRLRGTLSKYQSSFEVLENLLHLHLVKMPVDYVVPTTVTTTISIGYITG